MSKKKKKKKRKERERFINQMIQLVTATATLILAISELIKALS